MVNTNIDIIIKEIAARTNLDEEYINSLIQKKKLTVGSGYLTDTGAAYLVATDLGIALPEVMTKSYRLNEIVTNLKSINILCYFLSLSEPKQFARSDGSTSQYCKMLVFDDNIVSRVLIWNPEKIQQINFNVGEPILLENVYTKMGKDGRIEIHTTEATKIILQNEPSKKPEIIAREVSEIKYQSTELVITGILGAMRRIEFTKDNNTPANAVAFTLFDRHDPSYGIRTVIWSPTEKQLNSLIENSEALLINVRSRIGMKGNYEIYGDKDTRIIILREEPKGSDRTENRFVVMSNGFQNTIGSKRTLLVINKANVLTLTIPDKIETPLEVVRTGDILELSNYSIQKGKIFVNNPETNIKIVGNDESLLNSFYASIKDLDKKLTPIIIELVALSKPSTKPVKLKNGNTITRTELLVGDDTGETQLFAWEDNGKQLAGIMPGMRIIVYGALPTRLFNGDLVLQCREFTQVKIIYD